MAAQCISGGTANIIKWAKMKYPAIYSQFLSSDKCKADPLLKKNFPFVLYMAKKYQALYSPEMYDDVVSAGMAGMVIASQRYKPKSGVKFISYAVHWIRKEMLTVINSERKHTLINRVSLDSPVSDGDDNLVSDLIPDPKTKGLSEVHLVRFALSMIGSEEKDVLSLEMYHNLTQSEISKKTGVGTASITEIRKRAIRQFKNAYSLLSYKQDTTPKRIESLGKLSSGVHTDKQCKNSDKGTVLSNAAFSTPKTPPDTIQGFWVLLAMQIEIVRS